MNILQMRYFILAILISSLSFQSLGQNENHTCDLLVKVENIKKIEGSIKIAIYNHEDHFLSKEIRSDGQKIESNSLEFAFEGLGEGVYAISLFHDKNDNDKLDSNFIGIPTEPYAFSNNAKGMFGPPSFEDCKFSLSTGSKEITISL